LGDDFKKETEGIYKQPTDGNTHHDINAITYKGFKSEYFIQSKKGFGDLDHRRG
jgi:hypothetical protein